MTEELYRRLVAEDERLESRIEDLEEALRAQDKLEGYLHTLHGEIARAGVKLESALEHLRLAVAKRPKGAP